MKILVLGGGDSAEREVSLRSSAAMREALAGLGHEVSFADPHDGKAVVTAAADQAEVVFPILHGAGGEDGTVQGWLEETRCRFLGSGSAASKLCFNKANLKVLAAEYGIAVPRGQVVRAEAFQRHALIEAPFVLKPVDEGSTVGCLIARHLPYDAARAAELFAHYHEMLLEELVVGTEITVPVLGETALPVIEIVPPVGQEFDFENKYNGATAELCPPQHVTPEVQAQAQALAERIHRLAGCRHLSRTDMIVRSDDSLVLLEVNTMPGMTAQSLYPKAAAVGGLSWPKLVSRFLELTVS